MQARPGEVMGLFAFGHLFLDGNGRTMLLVHAELYRRAGFSVLWQAIRKNYYLRLVLGVIWINVVKFVAGGGAKAVDLGEEPMERFVEKLGADLERAASV